MAQEDVYKGGERGGLGGDERKPNHIKSLVIFGDSLSDTGLPFGLWSQNGQTVPLQSLGFYNERGLREPLLMLHTGRFTNGPVWCELLAQQHELQLVSFAVGGATINNIPGIPCLSQQVSKYLVEPSCEDLKQPQACIILAGGNDLLNIPPGDDAAAEKILAGISSGIASLAKDILARGCSTLGIANLPPMGASLFVKSLGPSQVASVQAAISSVNVGIAQVVKELSASGANVFLMDMSELISVLVTDPGQFGLTNITDPCIETKGDGPPLLTLRALDPTAVLVSKGPDPSTSLFLDYVHPTARGHEVIAGLMEGLFCQQGLLGRKQ